MTPNQTQMCLVPILRLSDREFKINVAVTIETPVRAVTHCRGVGTPDSWELFKESEGSITVLQQSEDWLPGLVFRPHAAKERICGIENRPEETSQTEMQVEKIMFLKNRVSKNYGQSQRCDIRIITKEQREWSQNNGSP